MPNKYSVITEPSKLRVGAIIKDTNGIKWQLETQNIWVIYKHSHIHKTKYKNSLKR